MSREENSYLRNEQRLADVIAAIQAMASNEYYERRSEKWAGVITGDEGKGSYWKTVFDEHPEFFRSTERGEGKDRSQYYSLIARRTLPHFDKATGNAVYFAEYENATKTMSSKDKRERYGRPDLADNLIKVLIDTAISLHSKAVEAHRDWRWWFAPAAAFTATILAAIFAFVAAVLVHKQ